MKGEDQRTYIIANQLKTYELLITRSISAAEKYALDLLIGSHQKSCKSNGFKVGWLESSKGSKMLDQLNNNASETEIGQWYVEPYGSCDSSCSFRKSATEFSCQGLE